jgi:hypothetical protein
MRFAVLRFILLLALVGTGFLGCGKPMHSENPFLSKTSSVELGPFAALKAKVFDSKCLKCHSGGSPDFTSYTALMAGGTVQPGHPETSELYLRCANKSMPQTGTPLTEAELNELHDWILSGAPELEPNTNGTNP